ncbi:MAG: hypothetical protein DRP82_06265 [Planctomycetota bacterium]|nr:MAG: hypothetical protein DRP82_06265 [Planctomycetota bacterium]
MRTAGVLLVSFAVIAAAILLPNPQWMMHTHHAAQSTPTAVKEIKIALAQKFVRRLVFLKASQLANLKEILELSDLLFEADRFGFGMPALQATLAAWSRTTDSSQRYKLSLSLLLSGLPVKSPYFDYIRIRHVSMLFESLHLLRESHLASQVATALSSVLYGRPEPFPETIPSWINDRNLKGVIDYFQLWWLYVSCSQDDATPIRHVLNLPMKPTRRFPFLRSDTKGIIAWRKGLRIDDIEVVPEFYRALSERERLLLSSYRSRWNARYAQMIKRIERQLDAH